MDGPHTMSGLEKQLFESLGCTEEQTHSFIQEVLDDIVLFDQKQRDYGPTNISAFGEKGVLVRTNDKMARLINLVWSDKDPTNESVEDSWRDLSVYGVIARLVRTGRWLA